MDKIRWVNLVLLIDARHRGGYSNSDGSTFRKQRGNDGYTRDEYQTSSHTNIFSLCYNHLPVPGAEVQGHRAEDIEKAADKDRA